MKSLKNAKVLVTGHTGFKGSWLTYWLTQLGARVSGISLDIPTQPSHFNLLSFTNIEIDIRGDVRDGLLLSKTIEEVKPDFIFHLAAQPLVRYSFENPVETWSTNLLGTVNVLESLRRLKSPCVCILVTSDKSYKNKEWLWGYKETDELGGHDPYSSSKGAAELAIQSYVNSFFPSDGLVRIGVGRAGNVIGGGDWASDRLIPDAMRSWAKNHVLEIRNSKSTRPWQHVLEPLSGYLQLAVALKDSARLHGEAFNFGPSDYISHSVGDVIEEMANIWGGARWINASNLDSGPKESSLLKLNCEKAIHFLNWRSTWGFKETIQHTVDWYKAYYQDNLIKTDVQINQYLQSARVSGLEWAKYD